MPYFFRDKNDVKNDDGTPKTYVVISNFVESTQNPNVKFIVYMDISTRMCYARPAVEFFDDNFVKVDVDGFGSDLTSKIQKALSIVIRSASGCGYSHDDETVFCDDSKLTGENSDLKYEVCDCKTLATTFYKSFFEEIILDRKNEND